jgi:hypothetical protein
MAKPDKDWSLKQMRAREALNVLVAKNGGKLAENQTFQRLSASVEFHMLREEVEKNADA